ncbi:exosome complex component RRP43-like [Penaeus chinensis]|uniref:exosome complex component RRP43-like n=1 Tax=Penaeus chinensis TaxID=139456 RepID=UPI001FB7FAE1|nr:exosome complex component RRP43-like [Penaeus chinensis]
MTTNETWKSFEPDSYYRSFLDKKKRPDGRGLTDSRNIMIRVGTVTTAEGSSTVRMGHTTVMCGIKAEIATPALRQPDQGLIVPNVELYACCSPMFKAGPPGEKAISTSQFLKNVIISSGMLDLTELCIVNNKYVWCLYCDIVCLNYDGNLTDAALVALVAALQNVRLPATSFDLDDQRLQVQSLRTVKVNVKAFPVASTFTLYSEDIQLMDPTAEDERQGNGEVTLVLLENDSVCTTHKPGGRMISEATLSTFVTLAKKRVHTINRSIRKALSET